LLKVKREAKSRIQQLQTVTVALDCLDIMGIRTQGISSFEIVEGNLKIVLGLMWSLVSYFQIQDGGKRSVLAGKRALLVWVKNQVKAHDLPVANFAAHFRDGRVLCALVDALVPGELQIKRVLAAGADERKNLERALDVAETSLDIPRILDPDDFLAAKPDETSILTYVSFFRMKWNKPVLDQAAADAQRANLSVRPERDAPARHHSPPHAGARDRWRRHRCSARLDSWRRWSRLVARLGGGQSSRRSSCRRRWQTRRAATTSPRPTPTTSWRSMRSSTSSKQPEPAKPVAARSRVASPAPVCGRECCGGERRCWLPTDSPLAVSADGAGSLRRAVPSTPTDGTGSLRRATPPTPGTATAAAAGGSLRRAPPVGQFACQRAGQCGAAAPAAILSPRNSGASPPADAGVAAQRARRRQRLSPRQSLRPRRPPSRPTTTPSSTQCSRTATRKSSSARAAAAALRRPTAAADKRPKVCERCMTRKVAAKITPKGGANAASTAIFVQTVRPRSDCQRRQVGSTTATTATAQRRRQSIHRQLVKTPSENKKEKVCDVCHNAKPQARVTLPSGTLQLMCRACAEAKQAEDAMRRAKGKAKAIAPTRAAVRKMPNFASRQDWRRRRRHAWPRAAGARAGVARSVTQRAIAPSSAAVAPITSAAQFEASSLRIGKKAAGDLKSRRHFRHSVIVQVPARPAATQPVPTPGGPPGESDAERLAQSAARPHQDARLALRRRPDGADGGAARRGGSLRRRPTTTCRRRPTTARQPRSSRRPRRIARRTPGSWRR
jgi:hypothetical protein